MMQLTPAQSGRDLKRKLLLDAAYRVFTDNGYHRARLETVAQQAGYSKASVYNYFEDKEELFLQTSIAATKDCVEMLEQELQSDRSMLVNLECMLRYLLSDTGQLFSFVQAVAEYHGEHPMSSDPERQRLIKQHRAGLRNILKTLSNAIETGKHQKELACEVDSMSAARFLTGLVRSVLLRWRLDGRKTNTERELSEIMMFARNGLSAFSG